jgi:CRISPR-associated endonuclease Cas1/group II intron reverse transcriptase/maturase
MPTDTLPLARLLPLRSAIATLRFLEDSSPAFFHQPALGAFLRYLAGSPPGFEHAIRFDAPESGRIRYQAGDYYRFSLLCLSGGEPILRALLRNLAGLPGSSPKTERPLPFRDNCALVALHDAFSGQPVACFEELSAYDGDSLWQEAELWRGQAALDWQFLAPARLLKDKARRGAAKGEARYCRNRADIDAALLSARLHDSLAELLRARGVETPPRPPAPALQLLDGHLFWMDAAYTDAAGASHTMGGMSGRLRLGMPEPPPADWLRQALLGQYAGLGQRAAFGYGRYRLQAPDGALSCRRALPAASLLMQAREDSNLAQAWRHIQANQARPAADFCGSGILPRLAAAAADEDQGELAWDTEPEAPTDEMPLARLQLALDRALQGGYQPPALRGCIQATPAGGIRPLAVPPFFDRVLQRAVAQIISPALEAAQYGHSYGYRAGKSRLNARDAVQAAARQGYRWVYESDIDDFFDSVAWDRLEDRLRALYGEDPAVDLMLAWISQPVGYQGQTLARKAGLPQGSPLSPVLANLMLDDFDSDMEVLGFKLIRYADDFVVLCKSQAQAESAHRAAAASLAEHGFSLNPGKTRIAATAQGFRYLGYLFVNDLAVDVSGHRPETQAPPQIPPNSWLARLGGRVPTPVAALPDAVQAAALQPPLPAQEGAAGAQQPDASRPSPALPDTRPDAQAAPAKIGQMDSLGQLLCVSGEPALLSTHADRLRVERAEQTLHDLPWQHLQAVILFGPHTLTTPALQAALKQGVPVHFASSSGTYRGVLWNGQPAEPGCGLWLKQANLFADPALCLSLAQAIVAARIRHLRETLRLRGAVEAAERLKARLDSLPQAHSLEALNGVEGAAAREFFQALAALLPPEWGFAGRNRQPPRDPANALLSFGYTLLHGYVATLLQADGLLPWLGFYHQAHGRHATLASDLMEPFRHLVERAALSAIQHRELRPPDFFTAANGACMMRKEARRAFLARLLEGLNTPVAAHGEDAAHTPVQHIHRQNLALIRWLNQGEAFHAFRTR